MMSVGKHLVTRLPMQPDQTHLKMVTWRHLVGSDLQDESEGRVQYQQGSMHMMDSLRQTCFGSMECQFSSRDRA